MRYISLTIYVYTSWPIWTLLQKSGCLHLWFWGNQQLRSLLALPLHANGNLKLDNYWMLSNQEWVENCYAQQNSLRLTNIFATITFRILQLQTKRIGFTCIAFPWDIKLVLRVLWILLKEAQKKHIAVISCKTTSKKWANLYSGNDSQPPRLGSRCHQLHWFYRECHFVEIRVPRSNKHNDVQNVHGLWWDVMRRPCVCLKVHRRW